MHGVEECIGGRNSVCVGSGGYGVEAPRQPGHCAHTGLRTAESFLWGHSFLQGQPVWSAGRPTRTPGGCRAPHHCSLAVCAAGGCHGGMRWLGGACRITGLTMLHGGLTGAGPCMTYTSSAWRVIYVEPCVHRNRGAGDVAEALLPF